MANRRSRLRRKVAIVLVVVVSAWVLFAVWLLGTAWRRVPGYEPGSTPDAISLILGADDYDAVIDSHTRPYVFTVDAGTGGRVVVFGAEHTKDPDDPQIEAIRDRWEALQPTVALVESDLGVLFPAFMNPVETFGEVGAVHGLARAAGISTYTWEPPDDRVIRSALDQGFTSRQVALRWVLGPYFANLRHGKPDEPEKFVLDTLADRSDVDGIRGLLNSMTDIERAWRVEFPDGPDWRDVSDQYGLPGFLGEIDLNRIRDEHLVSCVAELVGSGEKVFVICGSSHAVKIEPALRSIAK